MQDSSRILFVVVHKDSRRLLGNEQPSQDERFFVYRVKIYSIPNHVIVDAKYAASVRQHATRLLTAEMYALKDSCFVKLCTTHQCDILSACALHHMRVIFCCLAMIFILASLGRHVAVCVSWDVCGSRVRGKSYTWEDRRSSVGALAYKAC